MSKTTTTRRSILAGLVAAPVAGLPALAGAVAAEADPIFAALAERDRLEALLLKAIDACNLALDTGSPELEALEEAQGEACLVVCESERQLFATVPTTAAGALALLRFMGSNSELIRDREEEVAGAIRAAVAVLEREARV